MSDNAKIEEQKAKATKTLMTMLDYLGLEATLRVEEKGAKIAIKIASEDAGRIIGRKGQTLESLQLLLNRIMFRGEEECPHILLDIDGYARGNNRAPGGAAGGEEGEGEEASPAARAPRRERDNRRREGGGGRRRREDDENDGGERQEIRSEDQLRGQALDCAKEVKRWGESVTLPPMNAHDRRIIHVTLQDDPEITTQSEGEGNLKKVVISLKKD